MYGKWLHVHPQLALMTLPLYWPTVCHSATRPPTKQLLGLHKTGLHFVIICETLLLPNRKYT